jgi:uncharacterized protein (DUF2336 family)
MDQQIALLTDLEGALAGSAMERRTEIMRKVADLFVIGSADYSDDQIVLFDDVFTRLVANIETAAREALATRLAATPLAPPKVSHLLACDNAVAVAAPLLEHCERLDRATLLETARGKSQGHMLALSRRRYIDETLTDILVERGNRAVVLSAAGNLGARFSDVGFTILVKRSEGDDELACSVGARRELPRHHLLKLLAKASDTVRRRLEAADPLGAEAIRSAVAEAATLVQAKTRRASRDYAAAEAHVDALQATGQLNEAAIEAFVRDRKVEEVTVALTRLCDMPLESMEMAMLGDRPETVLILAKAVGLSWATVKALLGLRQGRQALSRHELEQCLSTFSRLKPATARQVLAFQRRRTTRPPQAAR